MGFPPHLLNDYEEVVVDLNPHWWFLVGPITAAVGAVIASIVLARSADGAVVSLGSALMLGGAGAWLLVRALRWRTTNFVVTSDRLIFRSGVVAKHGIEIPLERVNNVIFHQTVFERILGAGDLLIESAGESGQQLFTDIARPSRVQNEIYRQIEANSPDGRARTATDAGGGPVAAGPSVPDQIEHLDRLRRSGALTEEEFQTAKADLLKRL